MVNRAYCVHSPSLAESAKQGTLDIRIYEHCEQRTFVLHLHRKKRLLVSTSLTYARCVSTGRSGGAYPFLLQVYHVNSPSDVTKFTTNLGRRLHNVGVVVDDENVQRAQSSLELDPTFF